MNGNEEEQENGWKVLNGDDDNKEETPAGATAVGGHGRNAEGRAGNAAASDGRPAAAGRAGGAARAPARRTAPRLADSLRLDAVVTLTNPAETEPQDCARPFRRDAKQARRNEHIQRGHSPSGLNRQMAWRLARGGSANAVGINSIGGWLHCRRSAEKGESHSTYIVPSSSRYWGPSSRSSRISRLAGKDGASEGVGGGAAARYGREGGPTVLLHTLDVQAGRVQLRGRARVLGLI